jgi:hypothetical protein
MRCYVEAADPDGAARLLSAAMAELRRLLAA